VAERGTFDTCEDFNQASYASAAHLSNGKRYNTAVLNPARLAPLIAAVLALAIGTASAAAPAGVNPDSPGDLNCDANLDAKDSLILVTHLSDITFPTHPACPAVGGIPIGQNGKIAFTDNTGDIIVMDPDGTDQVNLTDTPEWEEDAAWSPDGKRIAFTRYEGGEGNGRIYIMDADGSNVVPVTSNPDSSEYSPQWSRDGRRILFTSLTEGTGNDIAIINTDGTGRQDLTSDEKSDSGPIWSPIGHRIAFTSNRSGNCCHVYLMNPDGTNIIPLVDTGNYESPTDWTVQGDRLLIYVYDGENANIFVYSPGAGGDPTPLTDTIGRNSSARFSPDGEFIVFASNRDDPDPANCGPCYQQIYTMTSLGAAVTPITDLPGENYEPDWQPVGGLFGDLNCDGVIDQEDLLISLQAAADLPIDGLPPGCDPP
jgi:Tol biopolymer transport system component